MTTQSNHGLDVELKPLRDAIDVLDDRIIALLAERFVHVREVAKVKARLRAPVLADARFQQIKARLRAAATSHGIDAGMVEAIYQAIHVGACQLEQEVVAAQRVDISGGTQ
ncbi:MULTISPECIES: chorismate mutase [Pandoraea]|uniref:chorismate mutase n=1 Tax=Pandoraea communis TaxID=2508297 RepID=A0A5E4R8X0_9BURK|nr:MULTISPECIES: chorismate mutase [Pandoraea]EON13821.1 chorismate mutase family protein [Pandoraea sp. SD6-2]MDM8359573.1 chorismate mutase [Pandoraea communis]VVD59263.1 chorismate mutase family protein [Pandoraea communis]